MHLCSLFRNPFLVAKTDVEYVWRQSISPQLKDLVVLVIVAGLESPPLPQTTKRTIDQYEDLAKLEGFTTKLYQALKMWCGFKVTVKERKDKWVMMLRNEETREGLMVEETVPKAESECARIENPFKPGEVIELDDD